MNDSFPITLGNEKVFLNVALVQVKNAVSTIENSDYLLFPHKVHEPKSVEAKLKKHLPTISTVEIF